MSRRRFHPWAPIHRFVPTFAATLIAGGLACACSKSDSKSDSKSEPPQQDQSSSQPAAEAADASARSYGQPLSPQEPTTLSELVASPDQHAGKTVLIEGKVRRACSAKGCWLELATTENPEAPACRVTFKDYGFFVPTDSAGALARVQGTVEVTQVKKSHVEHLEGEGATFEKKGDDGTATELRIVATGVELRRS